MTTAAGVARANELGEQIADLVCEIKDRVVALEEIGVEGRDIGELITPHLGPAVLEWADAVVKLFRVTAPGDHATAAIRVQLDVLFAEAPAPIDGTSPAIPDIAIVLRSFPHPISGVLTKCGSGTLKLGAVEPSPGPGRAPALLEHFFVYEDIVALVVRREMKAAPASSIITSH